MPRAGRPSGGICRPWRRLRVGLYRRQGGLYLPGAIPIHLSGGANPAGGRGVRVSPSDTGTWNKIIQTISLQCEVAISWPMKTVVEIVFVFYLRRSRQVLEL